MKLVVILSAVGVVVLLAVIAFVLVGRKPDSVDKSLSTYSGAVSDYRGDKKLVVAFTASWASFWKITSQELSKLDKTKYDLCILDNSVDKVEIQKFGIKFLPTVVIIENGKIIKTIQNLSKIEQLNN